MPHSITRRTFIARTAVAAAGTALLPVCAEAAAASFPIVDTHTHFYDPTRPLGVPWPPKDDKILYRPVLPDEFEKLARPLGIAGTVIVEASAWVADNQWVLDLVERHPFLLGLVGHLEPDSPDFAKDFVQYSANRNFLGIRIGGNRLAEKVNDAAFMKNVKLLADQGFSLDLLIGTAELPAAAQLAQKLPALRILINHVANVRVDGQAPPIAWVTGMQAAAKHPNVYCKVSGLVEGTGKTNADAPSDPAIYRPVLDTVFAAFGQNRLIFGSNWPVSARFAPLPRVVEIVKTYFDAKGPAIARKYFLENARSFYRWKKPLVTNKAG